MTDSDTGRLAHLPFYPGVDEDFYAWIVHNRDKLDTGGYPKPPYRFVGIRAADVDVLRRKYAPNASRGQWVCVNNPDNLQGTNGGTVVVRAFNGLTSNMEYMLSLLRRYERADMLLLKTFEEWAALWEVKGQWRV